MRAVRRDRRARRCATPPRSAPVAAGIDFFERYLTLWVAACIVVGIALGQLLPGASSAIGGLEVAQVNLPVAVLIWLMIIPMLLKIDFAALREVGPHWRGIGVTLFVNWAVKPFSMALLAWLFIGTLFAPWLPADQIDSYIAGLILLGRGAVHGDGVRLEQPVRRRAAFHAVAGGAQRPDHGGRVRADRRAAARPLGDHRAVGHAAAVGRCSTSSCRSIVAQLLAARAAAQRRSAARSPRCSARLHPLSLAALLATLVLLFGFQGGRSCASRWSSRCSPCRS